jgi:hypothetical protein
LLFGLGGGGFLDWFGWLLMVRGFAVFFLWLDALWTMFGSYFSRLGFFHFWALCLAGAELKPGQAEIKMITDIEIEKKM